MAWRLWRKQHRPEACIRQESQTAETVHKTLASGFEKCFRASYSNLFGIAKQELNIKTDFVKLNSKQRVEV